MKKLILFLIISTFILTSCDYRIAVFSEKDIKNQITVMCEKAYFEGQTDAIHGDIRIKYLNDSVWVWTKSPWNDGSKPTFKY